MKLNEFRKLFRDLPKMTQVMLIVPDTEADCDGKYQLEPANAIAFQSGSAKSPYENKRYAFIYYDPDKEFEVRHKMEGKRREHLTEFRNLFYGLPPDTEIMIVEDWMGVIETKLPLLDANSIGVQTDEIQWDEDALYVYIYHNPEIFDN